MHDQRPIERRCIQSDPHTIHFDDCGRSNGRSRLYVFRQLSVAERMSDRAFAVGLERNIHGPETRAFHPIGDTRERQCPASYLGRV